MQGSKLLAQKSLNTFFGLKTSFITFSFMYFKYNCKPYGYSIFNEFCVECIQILDSKGFSLKNNVEVIK